MSDKMMYATEKKVNRKFEDFVVQVYVDADWGGSSDGRSTSGVRVGVNGYALGHSSQTQAGLPALSTAEAELRAISKGLCDGLYTSSVLRELGIKSRLEIFTDAKASFQAASKLGGGRLKHLRIADYFIKDVLRNKKAKLIKIDGKVNPADVHTKHLKPDVLKTLWKFYGFRPLDTDGVD
eukprot:2000962-Amphidinium_carterae.1